MGGATTPGRTIGGLQRFALLTASGIFTPPDGLIAAGGVVTAYLGAGAGGGGGVQNLAINLSACAGGGAAGEIVCVRTSILVPTAYAVGAGGVGGIGIGGNPGNNGLDTTFGAYTARGGGGGSGAIAATAVNSGNVDKVFGGGSACAFGFLTDTEIAAAGGGAGNGSAGFDAFSANVTYAANIQGVRGLLSSGGMGIGGNAVPAGNIKAGDGGYGIDIPNYGNVGGGGGGGNSTPIASAQIGNGNAGGGRGALPGVLATDALPNTSSGGGGAAWVTTINNMNGGSGADGFIFLTWFE